MHKKGNITYLTWTRWFEAMLGLKVNPYKSEILPIGVVENEEISFPNEMQEG